jgi:hypothetical protein
LLDLTGYLQADAVPWSDDSEDELTQAGDVLNQERFLIRRGRVRFEAHRDQITGALELDGNTVGGTPVGRLLGANITYAWPSAKAPLLAGTIGLFKTPFGAEVPASERDKPFLEPPAFARALFPGNYDAGVMLSGQYGLARYAVALMNGAPVGDTQWKGKDPTGSFDLVARIGALVKGPYRFSIEAGVSAITGKGLHAGTPATKDDFQWVDENQDGIIQTTELQIIPGSPGTPSQTFDRDALGADVTAHWYICPVGPGTGYFEVVLANNLDRGLIYADPLATNTDRTLRHLGYAVGAVQGIGEHAVVGVRYDRYNADRDAFEREGVPIVGIDRVFSTLSVMATARWREARLLVQFDHERNPFGRSDTGRTTTREADRLSIRAQVGF